MLRDRGPRDIVAGQRIDDTEVAESFHLLATARAKGPSGASRQQGHEHFKREESQREII